MPLCEHTRGRCWHTQYLSQCSAQSPNGFYFVWGPARANWVRLSYPFYNTVARILVYTDCNRILPTVNQNDHNEFKQLAECLTVLLNSHTWPLQGLSPCSFLNTVASEWARYTQPIHYKRRIRLGYVRTRLVLKTD